MHPFHFHPSLLQSISASLFTQIRTPHCTLSPMAAAAADSPVADANLTSDHLPPDPLLEPGSFIDANAPDPVQDEEDLDEPDTDEPDLAAEDDIPATPPAANGDAATEKTPVTGKQADAAPETPKWLPEGWKMVCKTRQTGATAGSIDRYFLEPSGQRFRSKKEVDYFLQTGTKRKRILPTDAASLAAESSESPGGRKQKKSSSSTKKPGRLSFDFKKVPEMACWKLKDASNDHWVPFMDDKMVTKSSKQEWDAAFQFLSTGNNNVKPV